MSQDIPTGVLVAQAAHHGASDAFLGVLATDTDGRHHARAKVTQALRSDREPTPDGFGAGGWYTALWRGETERAWRRADGANRPIMQKAGLKPVTSGASAPARQD